MKPALLLALLLVARLCAAQPSSHGYKYGTDSYDKFTAATRLPDGSIILTGTLPPDEYSWQDVYVEKLSVNGEITEWTTSFGSNQWDEPYDIIAAIGGGYLVVGATRTGSESTFQMFERKINPDGSPDWQVEYGQDGFDAAVKVFVANGGYTIAGYTRPEKYARSDFRLVHTDAAGQELWHHDYGGSEDEMCYSAAQAADGSILIAGYTQSWDSQDMDLYMVHAAADGTVLHEFYEVESLPNVPYAVVAVNNGFVVAGTVYRHPDTEMPNPFLMNVNLQGQVVWRREYLDGQYAEPRALTQTASGFALAGFTQGNGLPDGWVLWTDENGNALEEWTVGRNSWEEFRAVACLNDSNLLVAGFSTDTPNGESDFYRYHVGDTVGVRDANPVVPRGFRFTNAWPNPFNSVTRLNLETPHPAALRLVLYDLLGREVRLVAQQRVNAGEHNFVLAADDLASGMYVVRAVVDGSPVAQRRLVVMK